VSRHAATPERTVAFSDAVFAILITILVLDLRPPGSEDWRGLLSLWPKALSYAASYFFLAIVWLNHHYLLRYTELATPRLLWGNFAHLFSVSLVPFATAWISDTHLGSLPVSVYAAIFFLVNATYLVLFWEGINRSGTSQISPQVRRVLRVRSFATLGLFALAALTAMKYPLLGMALVCLCLILYVRPEAPARD